MLCFLLAVTTFKFPSTQKCVLLNVTSLECCFTLHNDACPESDTRTLFSHSSAEKESFYVLTLNLSLIMVQYAIYTSVKWKPEASSEHTMRMDFSVNIMYLVVKLMKIKIFACSWILDFSIW